MTSKNTPKSRKTAGAMAKTPGKKPRKPTAASVKREVIVTWTKVVEAEERSKLMRVLAREGIGTREVEREEERKAAKRLGVGKGARKEENVTNEMWERLKDNEEWENIARKDRGRRRNDLEKLIGSKSNDYKRFINITKEKMKNLRDKLRKKHETKVKQLVGQRKKEEFKLPKNLSRYQTANIFTSDAELIPEDPKGPVIVGEREIILSAGEKAVLTRGPKFTVRRIMNLENFINELTKCSIKERWEERVRQEREEVEEGLMDEQEKQRIERLSQEEEARTRQVYDVMEGRVDFANLRVTDTKGNTKVILPKPGSVEFEMELEMKRIEWTKIFTDYVEEMCDDEGVQESNLTEEEEEGLKSLKKRVAEGEIIVCQTDKSGRFAIMTMEDYRFAGSKHVKGDKEVDLKFVNKNQRVLN